MFCIFWRVSMQNDRPIFARPVGHELDPPSSLCRSDAFLQDTPAPPGPKVDPSKFTCIGIIFGDGLCKFSAEPTAD